MPDPNYDPVKAHQYYLEKRQLKGRRHGVSQQPMSKLAKPKNDASAQAKVHEIEAKLNKLRDLLRKKLASSSSHDKKTPTAGDKLKQKQQSKAYYEKHKQKIAQEKKKNSSGGGSSSGGYESMSADELKTAIRNTVVQLKEAIANARR